MRALLFACLACAGLASAADPTAANRAAIFTAAGFNQVDGQWKRCTDDTAPSYVAGSIDVQDLNDDGEPEAWVRESSGFCYGAAGEYFVLLRNEGGKWRVLLESPGMALPLETKHGGWRDLEVGGPGATAVYRWNGKAYAR